MTTITIFNAIYATITADMNYKKPLLITGASLLVTGATIGAITMNSGENQSTQKPVVKSSVVKEEPVTTQPEPVAEPVQPEQQAAARVAEPPVTPTPPQPQGDYGERPDKSGLYTVFNKSAVLQAAGVPESEVPAAIAVINRINAEWNYNSTLGSGLNICKVNPTERMATAGADYRTNPVTQLKWCSNYVTQRYGSWQVILDRPNLINW